MKKAGRSPAIEYENSHSTKSIQRKCFLIWKHYHYFRVYVPRFRIRLTWNLSLPIPYSSRILTKTQKAQVSSCLMKLPLQNVRLFINYKYCHDELIGKRSDWMNIHSK